MFKKNEIKEGKIVASNDSSANPSYSITPSRAADKINTDTSLSAELSNLDGAGKPRVHISSASDRIETVNSSSNILRRRFAAAWIDSAGVAALAAALATFVMSLSASGTTSGDLRFAALACVVMGILECVSGGAGYLLAASSLTALPFIPYFNHDYTNDALFAVFATMIASIVYHIIFESITGSTPGKKLLGLIVNNKNGEPAFFPRIIIRHLARSVGVASWCLPLLPLWLSNEHQLVHDRIAGTFIDNAPEKDISSGASQTEPSRLRRFVCAPELDSTITCATLKQRIGSSVIDAAFFYIFELVLYLLSELAASYWAPTVSFLSPDPLAMISVGLFFVPAMLIPPLVMALFECSFLQATPGKLILGLRISDLKGNRINFFQAVEKQLAQLCAYFSVTPVWMVGLWALSLGQHSSEIVLAAYALAVLAYGALVCLTFRNGKQSVIDQVSKRLVLQNKLSLRWPSAAATGIFTMACLFTIWYAGSRPAMQAFEFSLVNSLTSPIKGKFINLSNIMRGGMHYGFVDHSGNLKVKAIYEQAGDFHDKLAPVRVGNKWGFINTDGKLVVPLSYHSVDSFSDGVAPVQKRLFWTYIDTAGHELPIKEDLIWAKPFESGVGVASRYVNSHFENVLITRKGEVIVPRKKRPGEKVSGPIIEVSIKNGTAFTQTFVTTSGVIITDNNFEHIQKFSEGKGGVSANGLWGYIDSDGKLVIKPTFEDVGEFHGGVATAKKNGLYGLINTRGQFILKPQYKKMIGLIKPTGKVTEQYRVLYSEGLIPIISERRWGFASTRTGKLAIKPAYAEVGCFHDNLAFVVIAPDCFWEVPKAEEEETEEPATEESKSSEKDK